MISQHHPVLAAMARHPDLAAARDAVERVLTAADLVIEQAERDGDQLYCVPVKTMDALSTALTSAGGAA